MKGKITITGEGVLQRDSNDLVKTPGARRQITALKDIPIGEQSVTLGSTKDAGRILGECIDKLRDYIENKPDGIGALLSGEYHGDCNKLMLENTELKAQVERLREFVLEVRDEFPCDYDSVDRLLKETPKQSLAEVKADAVFSVINHIKKAHGFTMSEYGQGLAQGFKDSHEQASAKAELIRQGEF